MRSSDTLFEKIKYDAQEYIGIYITPVDDLSEILNGIVERNGLEIFSDTVTLAEEMRNAGVSEMKVHKVCLMTQVTGFAEMVKKDAGTVQIDLERYIQNAVEETGFNRDTVLHLTGMIANACGIAMNYAPCESQKAEKTTDIIKMLATMQYRTPLNKFEASFESIIARQSAEVKLDFDSIEPLVNIGVPRAKYYLGYCLLKGIQLEENKEQGLKLLQEAADSGDSKAAGVLGDYFFAKWELDNRSKACSYYKWGADNWSKAYDYYTGFGAAALTKPRRTAVVSILNHKLYNKKLLALCMILFCVLLATVIWSPATTMYSPHIFWGWTSIIIQAVLLIVKIVHYKIRPYDCVYTVPVAMAGIWFVYMAIRVLF